MFLKNCSCLLTGCVCLLGVSWLLSYGQCHPPISCSVLTSVCFLLPSPQSQSPPKPRLVSCDVNKRKAVQGAGTAGLNQQCVWEQRAAKGCHVSSDMYQYSKTAFVFLPGSWALWCPGWELEIEIIQMLSRPYLVPQMLCEPFRS